MKNVSKKRKRNLLSTFLFYSCVIVVTLLFIFPFFWMVFGSLKLGVELKQVPPPWLSPPTLTNFRKVVEETLFISRLINSLIVTGVAVIIGIILGLPAAYSIARYHLKEVSLLVLFIRMIPGISFLVPWFIIYRRLNLLDTYLGMVASHLVITLPLIISVMVGFFEDLPPDMEQAAQIDGCSKWQSFTKIVLPLCRPGIATSAILSTVFSWNHFLFALILAGPETNTLPITIFQFMTYEEIDFGGIYASAALTTAPVIFLMLLIQNQFVEGLTMGGIKG